MAITLDGMDIPYPPEERHAVTTRQPCDPTDIVPPMLLFVVPRYDGTMLYVRVQHFPEPNSAQFQAYCSWKNGRLERCVVCAEVLETGDYVTHIWVTPQVLPHFWVHTKCWAGTAVQVEALIKSWQAAQSYAYWF
jgi:hypothetical protein